MSSIADLLNDFAEAGLPITKSSTALEASRAISGTAYLIGFTVANTAAAATFIQFHDAMTVPADGAVPLLTFTAPANGDKTVSYTLPGVLFHAGIVVCNSSTAPTKTVGSASCFFAVQFLPVTAG